MINTNKMVRGKVNCKVINRILGDKYSNNKKKKREEPKDWEETNEGQQWLASERRSSYSDRADNE